MQQGYDDSVNFAKEFCNMLVVNDFENAKGFLHPSSAPNKDRLKSFINTIESTNDIDFSNGFEIKNTVYRKTSYFDNAYEGSAYSFQFETYISNKTVNIFFVVVDNDIGYGIFYFGIIE